MLEGLKALFGENAPDKLFFQHFQKLQEKWQALLSKAQSIGKKADKLASLRGKEGCLVRCVQDPEGGLRIEEFHNPLQRVFERYPRAVVMEQRMIEHLLGTRVTRREIPGGRNGQPQVVFEVAAAGNP